MRAARLCAVLAAPLLALSAAPAAAQTLTVSIVSTPLNGQYYVVGEKILTRLSGLPAAHSPDGSTSNPVSDCQTRRPGTGTNLGWECNWMRIDVGGVTREAQIVADPTNRTSVDYEYTVQAADSDTDGVSIPANAIVGRAWRQGANALFGAILNRNHAALAAQSGHRVDGSAAGPRFSIDAPRVLEGDSGSTTMTFTVTLSTALTVQATVNYNDWSGGTATSGTDYTAVTGNTLTFAAGVTSQTVSVTVTGDAMAESDESIDLQLSNATPSAVTIPNVVGRGTIVDDDTGSTLSIDSPHAQEGTNLEFTVTLSPAVPSGHSVTVDWSDAGGGTAASGTDYTALAGGTLTFAAGVTTQTITVSAQGDSAVEPDETVRVQIGNAARTPSGTVRIRNGAVGPVVTSAIGVGTITDDYTGTLSIDSPRVAEGNSGTTDLEFTVTLSPAPLSQVTVDYADAGTGTATVADMDYTAVTSGTLTFAAGETRKTIAVSVTGDATAETDETVLLQLSNPVPSGAVIATGTGTGTIVDDDTPTLSIDSPRVAEGNSGTTELVFTVTLSPASTGQVSVEWEDQTTVTGTAEPGSDYTALSPSDGTLTFMAGETTKTITVEVLGDGAVEPDETVRVAISSPNPSGTPIRDADGAIAAAAVGVGTITNDDAPPASSAPPPPPPSAEKLVLSAEELEVATGAEGATYTLRLGAAPTGPVTVAISSDAPDVTAAPASLSFDASNWSAPQTVTVTAAADNDDYADTAPLTHTASGGGLDGETAVVTALVSEPGDTRVRAPAAGAPAAAYVVGEHRVEVRVAAGVPPGVEIVPPAALAADLSVTLRPVSDEAPLESGVFAFGAAEDAQVAVDVSVTGVPAAGLELCLPARAALREASGGRALTLLRHDGTAWVEVAGARLDADAERVCAAGITEFSPFAVGWRAAAPAVAGPSDARTRLAAVNRSILPEVSRAMWDGAASAVARRFGGGAPAGYDGGADANAAAWAADALSWLAGRLGAPGGASAARARGPALFHDPRPYGPPEDSPAPLGAGWRALLPGSAFALGLSGGAAGDGPDAALWGSGDRRSLSLDDGALSWEGEVTALHAGADARTAPDGSGGRVLGGVSASWSESDIDYTDAGGAESVKGRHEVSMASVQPYVGWLAGDGSRAWAVLSHGRGEVEIADAGAGAADSSATLTAAAVGARTRALSRGAAAVDVKGEAQAARFALDGDGNLIAGLSARTFRLRVAAEGRYVIAFANGGSLTPSLEAGLRWDGGDGATGAGVELGGGAAWSAPSSPLTLEARGRALLAHGGDAEEWGVGGALRVAPGSGGLGLSLALSPSWGAADSGLARLWSADAARADTSRRAGGRLDAEAGYGLRALSGVATPLAGFALTGDRSREWRVGGRLALAETLDLALATSLRETRTGAPDRRIALDIRLRW